MQLPHSFMASKHQFRLTNKHPIDATDILIFYVQHGLLAENETLDNNDGIPVTAEENISRDMGISFGMMQSFSR